MGDCADFNYKADQNQIIFKPTSIDSNILFLLFSVICFSISSAHKFSESIQACFRLKFVSSNNHDLSGKPFLNNSFSTYTSEGTKISLAQSYKNRPTSAVHEYCEIYANIRVPPNLFMECLSFWYFHECCAHNVPFQGCTP